MTFEPLKVPRTQQEPIRQRFWLGLVWFSMAFQRIKGALGSPWGPFGGAFGSFWVIFEPLKDPRPHQEPKWEAFRGEMTSIFIDFQNMSVRESACKLAFEMVCIIHSALLPAQFPTGLVAVWASPTG